MRYSVLNGGKRLRALLCCATCNALTGSHESSITAACALEMVHSYSLIHDDLPAMDDDQLRRGSPTCHIKFDEAEAILAGDALQAEAFRILAEQSMNPSVIITMIKTLSQAIGSAGMVGGQSLDMAAAGTTQQALEAMHRAKTGALLTASIQLGAQAAGAQAATMESLTAAGRKLGLAFQVIDDVLDVTGSTAQLGKDAGSDANQGKLTFVDLLGVEGARAYANDLSAAATEDMSAAFTKHTQQTGNTHAVGIETLEDVARTLVKRMH